MSRKIDRFMTVLLLVAICLSTVVSAADSPVNPTIRVGLAYGSAALPGANLENSTGSGYRLGYFDEDLNFCTLGNTAETQISVVKTQNVSLSGGNYVDGTSSGGVTVGCYHLQLPGSYGTFGEACSAAAAVQGGFPAWTNGVYQVRAGTYPTKAEAQSAQESLGLTGASVAGTSGYAVTVVATKTGKPVFQFDGGDSLSFGILPGLDDSVKTVTWFKGYRYYGGFRYLRQSGGNLTVINIVPLEDYVRGVLPYEMSNDWPLEALKAQAVCARTYAYMNLGKHGRDGFDICNTTDCQVYRGVGLASALTDQAVDETNGKYVWYDGQLAQTFYFSSDGGATEDVRNIWNANADMPYLVGVTDSYEALVSSRISQYNWTKTISKSEAAETLRGKGYNCGTIVKVYVSEYSPTGNPVATTFLDSAGKKWSFSPEKLRLWFGLRSNRFDVNGQSGGGGYSLKGAEGALTTAVDGLYAVDGSGAVTQISGAPYVITGAGTEQVSSGDSSSGDTVTFAGSGWGHNVGMSQWGANAMAGQGKTYIDILTFYFAGVEVR